MLRSLLLPAVALAAALFTVPALAQTVRAVASDGTAYELHDDGTWTVVVTEGTPPPPPPPAYSWSETGPPPPPAPPATVHSATEAYGLTYDASQWRLTRDGVSDPGLIEDSEFELKLPFDAAYAATIFEFSSFDMDAFADIVLLNAEAGGQHEVRLVEVRGVELGGKKMRQIEFEVTVPGGVEVTFITSFLSEVGFGTLQLTTWSPTSLMDRYRETILELHQGLRFDAVPK